MKAFVSTRKISGKFRDLEGLELPYLSFFSSLGVTLVAVSSSLAQWELLSSEIEVDSVILTGGDSFGEDVQRDAIDYALITYALEKKLPIFGICRGMQVINRYFGGTDHTDKTLAEKHIAKEHAVTLSPFAQKIFGPIYQKNLFVNSYHSQFISSEEIGNGLEILAFGPSLNVEAFMYLEKKIFAVMWHPDREDEKNSDLTFAILAKFLDEINTTK